VKERRRSSAYALCGAAYGTHNAAKNRGSMRHVLAHLVGAVRDVCKRLLWDSRVVDLPMAYNPTFVMLSFLKPLFFNSLKNESPFSDNAGA